MLLLVLLSLLAMMEADSFYRGLKRNPSGQAKS
jgi:hypothetical protein